MNWIVNENAQPGTDEWRITAFAATDDGGGHLVEGYVDACSVTPGQSLILFAQSASGAFSYQVFRMGYYAGHGGRAMVSIHGPR